MKKLILLLTILASANAGFAQTIYPSGVTGCIARWDFTNPGTFTSLPDVSGNSNNGTVTNITSAAGWRGAPNTAGNFNGSSSVATVPSNSLLSPSSITIIAIVKLSAYYSGQYQENNIIYKSFGYYQTGCWGMKVGDKDNNGSVLDPTTERVDFAGPGLQTSGTTADPIVNLNNWYFLATTYNGTVAKRYTILMDASNHMTNITPSGTSNYTAPLTSNSYDVKIGGTNMTSSPYYPYWVNGNMDEIALFNRVLADSEIQSVYDYLWGATLSINQPFADTILYPGATFNVNYTVGTPSVFTSGNTFVVQLSDPTGSFTTPVSIGTAINTASGTVSCTIPATTLIGTAYRIRIVGTSPSFTSADDGKNIKILPTGIKALTSAVHPFMLYPNPNKGSFTVEGTTSGNEAITIDVVNAIGQTVYQGSVKPVNNTVSQSIDINVANGLYTVRIKGASVNQTIPLLISK